MIHLRIIRLETASVEYGGNVREASISSETTARVHAGIADSETHGTPLHSPCPIGLVDISNGCALIESDKRLDLVSVNRSCGLVQQDIKGWRQRSSRRDCLITTVRGLSDAVAVLATD